MIVVVTPNTAASPMRDTTIRRTVGDATERRHTGDRGRNDLLGLGPWRSPERLLDDCVDSVIAAKFGRDAGPGWVCERETVRGEALTVEVAEMIPAAGRDVAGERASADIEMIVEMNLPDKPGRIIEAKRQSMIVACLRIAVAGSCRIAVEHRTEDGDVVRNLILDANAGHRDRRCGTASRQVACLDGRPAERTVDEEIVGLAVEELDIGSLLTGLDVQPSVKEALLEIGVVEPLVRQRLDLADSGEIVDIVAG
ncbi:hypothetical protein M2427_002601 [Bradyrhizobium sp. BR13661]|nr:hypothetical protein [Bradyrhizobium sp. BR13661]